jgi:predicted nucleic acid-binding protein
MPFRVVLDTNVLVRPFIDLRSASGLILHACEERILVPLLCKPVIAEHKYILASRELVERYPQLQPRKIR